MFARCTPLHCSFVAVPVTDYESPQSYSNWAPFSTFSHSAHREGGRDTLFGEEGERETEEECNYSLGASGALLPTATAAAADKELIWKSTW